MPQITQESSASHNAAHGIADKQADGAVNRKTRAKLGANLRTDLHELRSRNLLIAATPHCPVTEYLVHAGANYAKRKEPEVALQHKQAGGKYPVIVADCGDSCHDRCRKAHTQNCQSKKID